MLLVSLDDISSDRPALNLVRAVDQPLRPYVSVP